jgi:2-dehydropantoate 2-reductase
VTALRVAVLGPGGIGGLLAALLARSGHSVVVLAGESTAQAIGKRGIHVESSRFGDFHADVETAARLSTEVDACLITVKATQLEDSLQRVPAGAVAKALLVPFLNGIDHVAELRRAYPSSTVAAATIRIEVAKVGPGLIRHTSPFAAVEIATSADSRERADQLAAELKLTGLDVRIREDEISMLWDKLVLLGPMALMATAERANVGEVRSRRRDDAVGLIAEFAAVARSEGATVDEQAVVRVFDSIPDAMETSMLRDHRAGLPLEVDAIGGAVIRRAGLAGVPVPITSRLVEELMRRGK